jgi:hypothetical protein
VEKKPEVHSLQFLLKSKTKIILTNVLTNGSSYILHKFIYILQFYSHERGEVLGRGKAALGDSLNFGKDNGGCFGKFLEFLRKR